MKTILLNRISSNAYSKVRGFVSNSAGYQPLGFPHDVDPCQLTGQYNTGYNEIRYMD